MRRITIQYLIPVQVKSSQVEERSVLLGTWDLKPGRDSSFAVTVASFFRCGNPEVRLPFVTLPELLFSFFFFLV